MISDPNKQRTVVTATLYSAIGFEKTFSGLLCQEATKQCLLIKTSHVVVHNVQITVHTRLIFKATPISYLH